MPNRLRRRPAFKPPPATALNLDDPLTYGLVGLWALSEGGGIKLTDAAGLNSIAAVFTGTITWAAGPNGPALKFASVGNNVSLGNAHPIATNAVTVAIWIRPAVLTRGDLVTCWLNGSGNDQFDLLYGLTSGKPQFFVNTNGGLSSSGVGATAMVVGRWYHVCGTYDGATIRTYLNGVLQASAALASVLKSGVAVPIKLGNNHAGDGTFQGAMAGAAIWNRTLKASEIRDLYSEPTRPFVVPRLGLRNSPDGQPFMGIFF